MPDRKPKAYECAVKMMHVEEVTPAMIYGFLTKLSRSRGLSPKTLNEYREIIQRFFAWAIDIAGVRLPGE